MVEDGGKSTGGDASLADTTADHFLLGAVAVLPLGAQVGRNLFLTAGQLGL